MYTTDTGVLVDCSFSKGQIARYGRGSKIFVEFTQNYVQGMAWYVFARQLEVSDIFVALADLVDNSNEALNRIPYFAKAELFADKDFSAGVATALDEQAAKDKDCSGNVGIAHTRWATHGEPSATNAHPHSSAILATVSMHSSGIQPVSIDVLTVPGKDAVMSSHWL